MSIEVENLSFSYGENAVLKNVSFAAQKGNLVALLGRNGAGKTTLFRCILGFNRNYGGNIRLEGRDARTLSASDLSAMVSYIPQHHGNGFAYTVREMVLMGTAHSKGYFSMPGKEQQETALQALKTIGIENMADKMFSRISGGEQQLVLVSRALAQGGKILVMDEPTSALDFGNRVTVMQCIRKLANEDYTVLMSTHEPQYALDYADKVLALHDGVSIAYGDSSKILNTELLEKLYGAKSSIIETVYGKVVISGER